jgi:hypothetical protein
MSVNFMQVYKGMTLPSVFVFTCKYLKFVYFVSVNYETLLKKIVKNQTDYHYIFTFSSSGIHT